MRKKANPKLILTAAAILLFLAAVPDAGAVGRLTLGLKGGLNSANLRVKSDITVSTFRAVNPFAWGGYVSYMINPLFSVQAEVLDSPKGSKLVGGLGGDIGDTILMYDYTEVPLFLRWAQGFGGGLLPSLYAGGYWAHLREATIKTEGRLEDSSEPLPDQRGYDLGLVFGFSLTYRLGRVELGADARYSMGLVDVDESAGTTINHRGFSFLAGIGFGL